MKLILGIITLVFAIVVSVIAAYFSVVGLAALFAATAIPVIVMAASLEGGKLVAVQWLKSNWHNPKVHFWHKTYLLLAITALMLITALGIYGFLSKGHLEQSNPVAGVELQIAQKEQQITALNDQNARLNAQVIQLDAGFDALMKGNAANRAIAERNRQKANRSELEKQINENLNKIQTINSDILPLKMMNQEVKAKLGPVKYVAELFGMSDTESAVRIVILILMFSFDPLAIALLLSATITFSDWASERKVRKLKELEASNISEEPTQLTPKESEFIEQVIESGAVPPSAVEDLKEVVKKPRVKKKPVKVPTKRVTKTKEMPAAKTEPTLIDIPVVETEYKEPVIAKTEEQEIVAATVDAIEEAEASRKNKPKPSPWLGDPPSTK